jgi:hypothetical protein
MMDREEAIRRVVAERDMLFALLVRISKETVCIQRPSISTTNMPKAQTIYCFAADPDIHGRIQDICIRDALNMLPTPTQIPEQQSADVAYDHG